MLEPSDLERRRPVEGDHVTLFAIPEICYWTRQGASTIRRWIATGKIGEESITRPGGKIYMTGDQLATLRTLRDRAGLLTQVAMAALQGHARAVCRPVLEETLV